jgi:hypothetical protein
VGGRNLDARTMFLYIATVNTPAMALHIPGVGSQYAITEHDSRGEHLDGAKHYQLIVPPDVPAKDFWSVVVYDPRPDPSFRPARRSPVATTPATRWPRTPTARSPSPSDRPHQTTTPTTGSKTIPGKKWFTILRLYGPLEPWFDKTWVPGDIEPLDTH